MATGGAVPSVGQCGTRAQAAVCLASAIAAVERSPQCERSTALCRAALSPAQAPFNSTFLFVTFCTFLG